MKNDSPPSMLRLSDFMIPPWAFDSMATPWEVAIIEPDSARTASLGWRATRATAKLGLWRTVTSIGGISSLAGEATRQPNRGPGGRATAQRFATLPRNGMSRLRKTFLPGLAEFGSL